MFFLEPAVGLSFKCSSCGSCSGATRFHRAPLIKMARKFSPIVALALIFAVFYDPDTFEPESIRGKRVLITGASSGIGEELAYHYSQLGASVFVTARRADLLKKVVDKCREHGAERVDYAVADMASDEDRQRLVVKVRERLGGLDHLILNHARYSAAKWTGSAENMTTLRRDLEVNFVSFVDVASKSLAMLTESKGNIGVVSSVAGKIGLPLYTTYSADKFALHGFFTSLRQELSARQVDVSVTMLVLGYVDTETANVERTRLKELEDNYAPGPVSVNETATAIIKGVTKRAYELLYPTKSTKLIMFFHKIAPGYLENYMGSSMALTTAL